MEYNVIKNIDFIYKICYYIYYNSDYFSLIFNFRSVSGEILHINRKKY